MLSMLGCADQFETSNFSGRGQHAHRLRSTGGKALGDSEGCVHAEPGPEKHHVQ